ncbi:glycoside hydrolase family 13 [Phlyctema vagabunda]|uniref:Glycoside hydrolase family 13 n=1 Tax=Phlyctema vagabunda TaxID=108571 RepID=A0ABR4P945_9HELO
MQTTLGGTLFAFQGEEIGMRNAPTSWPIEEFKDIESINYWKKCLDLYSEDKEQLALGRKIIDMKARDHSRTPMQWSPTQNAGFCDPNVKPWMRVMDDYKTINVETQMNADGPDYLSVWQFWHRSLQIRKQHADVFVHGDFQKVDPRDPQIYAFLRTSKEGGK